MAFFQSLGISAVLKDSLNIIVNGLASTSADDFNNFGPIPSGPAAEFSFRFFIFSLTSYSIIMTSPIELSVSSGFSGTLFLSFVVKTLAKNCFSSSAISSSSITSSPFDFFSGPILVLDLVLDLM